MMPHAYAARASYQLYYEMRVHVARMIARGCEWDNKMNSADPQASLSNCKSIYFYSNQLCKPASIEAKSAYP